MISESEIRSALAAVGDDKLDVFEFADWFDSKSWGMHRDSSEAAIKLASSVDRVLGEYDYHRSEIALRRELRALSRLDLTVNVFVANPGKPHISSASASSKVVVNQRPVSTHNAGRTANATTTAPQLWSLRLA
jgi:hypothetical protein